MTKAASIPIRVLMGKPGLDGHDVGAKVACRALMAAGMHVTYTGLRQTPEAIADAAVREGADVVGLSILSGAHMLLCRRIRAELDARGLSRVLFVVGGNIPSRDHEALRAMGVHGIFRTGSDLTEMVRFIEERARR